MAEPDAAAGPAADATKKLSFLSSPYAKALIAGGIAGTAVDLSLFPLDTLKTRLQSSAGFSASGGFRNVYRGLGSVALGSAPSASLFFLSYDTIRRHYSSHILPSYSSAVPEWMKTETAEVVLASSVGEIAACAVRVPVEVVKQRAQATATSSSIAAFKFVLDLAKRHGMFREVYRGWTVTVAREIPFTVIQFPLWEYLKSTVVVKEKGRKATALQSALCGSVAGCVAAGLTTPLDVLKTRMMLADRGVGMSVMFRRIVAEDGWGALMRGVGPRMMWIGAGGAVFLGAFTGAKNMLDDIA